MIELKKYIDELGDNLDKAVSDIENLSEELKEGRNDDMVPQKTHLLSSAKEIIDGINYLDPGMTEEESKIADKNLWAEEQVDNILRKNGVE